MTSWAHLNTLRGELYSSTKGTKTITECYDTLREIANNLGAVGIPVDNETFMSCLLQGVGQEYEFVSKLISTRSGGISSEEAFYLLLGQEHKLHHYVTMSKGAFTENFFAVKNNGQRFGGGQGRGRGRGRSGGRLRPKTICEICEKHNHTIWD